MHDDYLGTDCRNELQYDRYSLKVWQVQQILLESLWNQVDDEVC